MTTMSSKSAPKPRIQRLRASCDGCFLAKVKCSKARPICSRCLTCGTDCKYSPSSRAGKPKANRVSANPNMSVSIVNPDMRMESTLSSPFVFDSNAITMASDVKNTPIFTFDNNWSLRSGSTDGSYPGSMSTTTTPSVDNGSMLDAELGMSSATSEFFDPSFAWATNTGSDSEHSIYQVDPAMMIPRSRSTNDVPQLNSFSPWLGSQQSIHLPHVNNNSPSTFDSPCSSPDFAGPNRMPASPCSCLKTCLQSLLALHDHSNPTKTPPTFDIVLTINRKAVEGCASMLACGSCASRSGSNTNAMLLATIMEKILSFYQEATRDYFGTMPGADSQMSIGSYQVTNEDGCWLKAEILWRELRKLEELLGHFGNVCGGRGGLDGTGVHSSLVNHLSQSLNFTFEIMKLQQAGFGQLQ